MNANAKEYRKGFGVDRFEPASLKWSIAASTGVASLDPRALASARFALPLGALVLILLAAGCASTGPVRWLVPAAGNPAVVEHNLDGTVTLRSQQTHIVSVLPLGERFSGDVRGLPAFGVIVTNGGKENITLKPGDIAAYAGTQRVALPNPVNLQERLDREQKAAEPRVSSPIGIRDASQPGQLQHGSGLLEAMGRGDQGSRPDPMGRPESIGRSESTGRSETSSRDIQPFGAPAFKVPARLVNETLEWQVIRPGDVGGGKIVLEGEAILSGLPLKIVVTVAGEKHEFLFKVRY